tara:strand:+ start:65 stop:313 length:249 start_codon:yes stop_codon:yes gene_type:complete
MARLTIYERLKPEIKEALASQDEKYSTSVRLIIATLSSTTFYSDLTIGDVSSLYTWADIDFFRVSTWDFKHGDNILISDKDE